MTTRKYSSRSQQTTLTGSLSSTATSASVVSGSALLGGITISAGQTYTAVIDPDTALEEIVDITAVSGNTITITRGIDGSSGQEHAAGAIIRHMMIGRDLREANTHIEASTGVHGIAAGSSVVGTTDTQTLTNKTLTSPTINNPTITGAGVDASIVFEGATADAYETTLTVVDPTQDNTITLPNTSGTVVLANATQTLTNKTMGDALNAGGFKITNLATPTNASDAVRKDFADAQVAAAATSATSAATSASSSATSATSSATSASSSATSASSSATSATASASSATAAASSATAAASSATSAASSATAAASSATSAASSATAASTSASSAATSATSSATSASSSATSASAAATSASAAATSATSAATSATSSATSASASATSASAAATSATSAATSATSSATSASASATSATAAASSATAAASSATSAAASAASVSSTATTAAELRQYGAEGSVLQNVPTRVHDAEQLLKQSVWWIDAAHSASNGQTIKNLGWGGSALDCTLGSSTSADSNDPQYLAWDGVNYVYTPGVNGNYLTIPDANNLDITGDIDIRAYAALDNWSSGAVQMLVAKFTAAGQYSYRFYVSATGLLVLEWSIDGTAIISKTSTVATGITAGTIKWVRATLDVNNGASGNDVMFYTSDDGTTWTQLGTTVTTSGTTSIFNSTSDVYIADRVAASGQNAAGKFFRAQICNGINGVPVLDVDTSVITAGNATSFTANTGQTVTINRATSGRKTTCVVNPVWLFGTDDYIEVNNRWLEHTGSNYLYLPGTAASANNATSPDAAALDITGDIDLRAKIAMDDWAQTGFPSLVNKMGDASSQRSYGLGMNGNKPYIVWTTGGTTATETRVDATTTTGLTAGATKWIRATLDVDNGASGNDVKFYTSDDGTTWTQLGSTVTTAGTTSIFSGTGTITIGGNTSTQNQFRGKFFRAQVYNGIGGTLAFDANFETGITTNLPTTFTESSANAATVTINYSGTGYRSCGVIASTYVYPGNPNTFKLSTTSLLDFASTDSATIFAVVRQWATPLSSGAYISKRLDNGTFAGWVIRSNGTALQGQLVISDGTSKTATATSTYTAGTIQTFAGVMDRSTNLETFYQNAVASATTDITGLGSLANIYTTRVGSSYAGYQDTEIVAAAIFRRALTAAEITTLTSYYSGRYGS